MPIDHAGTSPGLVPEEPKEKEINLKCKRCPSITAVEVDIQSQTARMYRCVKCNMAWTINVGGYFPY